LIRRAIEVLEPIVHAIALGGDVDAARDLIIVPERQVYQSREIAETIGSAVITGLHPFMGNMGYMIDRSPGHDGWRIRFLFDE
jgi:hypothetical protein